jgi:hypothetical protein
MTTIQILVKVIEHLDVELPDPPGPGHRFLFSNDLALERYDDSTPGSGLPQDEDQRLAGTHSGFVTLLRVAGANDRFFPDGSDLWQYDATYKFNTLDAFAEGAGHRTRRTSLSGRAPLGATRSVCDHWWHGTLRNSSRNDH